MYNKIVKRTGFKQKTYEEKLAKLKENKAKKKAKKRTKKPSVRLLKDKLWNECKRLTRERWGNSCYTCGKPNLIGSDWQTGHGKPKGALPLRYKFDIRNLRPQCLVCNQHRGGVSDIFIAKLEQEEDGIQFLNEACFLDRRANAWRIRGDIPSMGGKDATIFVENLLKQYKETSYN